MYQDFKDFFQPTTEFELLIVHLFAGYFMYDTIAIYMYDIPYKQLYAHHIICFGIFSITALCTHGGALFTYSFIICELSGPLQNTRDFMKTFGYKDTQAYAVLEMIFIVSFILLRGVIYTSYGIPDLI